MVKAGDAGPKYLEIIARSKFFRVAEFSERAAVEAAALTRDAIARVLGASTIYTNDGQLAQHAKAAGIEAIGLAGLPEPLVVPQLEMRLEPIEPEPPSSDGENDD